ncbi:hypothetical protein LRP31_03715 [Mesorhizobium mediterraneum]|uniref:hypothetical protein n=1 Tax=Mesorhizobium TaxID=68287 RepID=UPI000FCB39A8|nr:MULTISPECIES: hypothetical protein [Mesorhizobium]RUU41507.1 hypothetical protein EOC93_20080 [Mesorhizobium sp. M6A.T.Ce.TU.002.03.1.1]RWN44122.1 MAG: hypothetical protein EOR96_03000 [Mesorhizobium sp.]RWO97483.1 MAG: hypothetical protein EOQ98_18870 [Mesorhizobium sp.]RWP66386.1 MAG: hypothetical protein EOR09_33035 [Mesorhizobium sp.]WIW54362.1 hypothetical protein LRP31_03715 [Mesorhizobium mediterraneum]
MAVLLFLLLSRVVVTSRLQTGGVGGEVSRPCRGTVPVAAMLPGKAAMPASGAENSLPDALYRFQ